MYMNLIFILILVISSSSSSCSLGEPTFTTEDEPCTQKVIYNVNVSAIVDRRPYFIKRAEQLRLMFFAEFQELSTDQDMIQHCFELAWNASKSPKQECVYSLPSFDFKPKAIVSLSITYGGRPWTRIIYVPLRGPEGQGLITSYKLPPFIFRFNLRKA